jgi:hypothetical protein
VSNVLRQRLKTATLASVTILVLVAAPSICALPENDPIATITARIVQARDYTASYVALAKRSMATNPSDLQQAEKFYASAYADYNAWVAYVKAALQDGKTRNLSKDTDYQKIASDAASAGTTFTNFVDSKTGGPSKAVNVILSSLGALGLQLWNGIKDRRQQDRATAATNFEQETKWSPWDPSTTDAAKPSQPAQPTQPSKSPNPKQ